MPRIYGVFTVFLLLFTSLPTIVSAADSNVAALKQEPLSIKTAEGKTHDFSVEVAVTRQQQEQGLMHRKELPVDHGMLFIFDEGYYIQMWMKDTFISLDILFLDVHGKILSIAQNTKPNSLEIISAKRNDARVALELAGGVTAKLGIKPGDQVVYSYFKP